MIVWLTGLSGSGKTTLANAYAERTGATVLDGDEVRKTISSDLGFTEQDRIENARRVAHLANALHESGKSAVVALITPTEAARQAAKEQAPAIKFVYVSTPLLTCVERDPKGIYKRYYDGEIINLTGIDQPYERPTDPDLVIDTRKPISECVGLLCAL